MQAGGSSEDAADLFQDGLIIILEKIDEGRFELTCKFKTYLYTVCENLWNSIIDKRKAAANYISSSSEHHIEKDLSDVIDRELHENILKEVLETMDESSRAVLNLYWQELPAQEIADRLGFTYGYLRKKKMEAQNELISRIKQHPDYIRIMQSEKIANSVVK